MSTTNTPKVQITLSAAALGPEADEAFFDAWTSYVNEHIDEALSVDAEVEQAGFTGRTAIAEDIVRGADGDLRDAIREWLSVTGWEAFCAQPSAA